MADGKIGNNFLSTVTMKNVTKRLRKLKRIRKEYIRIIRLKITGLIFKLYEKLLTLFQMAITKNIIEE